MEHYSGGETVWRIKIVFGVRAQDGPEIGMQSQNKDCVDDDDVEKRKIAVKQHIRERWIYMSPGMDIEDTHKKKTEEGAVTGRDEDNG